MCNLNMKLLVSFRSSVLISPLLDPLDFAALVNSTVQKLRTDARFKGPAHSNNCLMTVGLVTIRSPSGEVAFEGTSQTIRLIIVSATEHP